jgi:transcriptional regulator with PAS, ATPase and Fis domain
MRILLIDDKYEDIVEGIKEAVEAIEPSVAYTLECCNDNKEENVAQELKKGYDLIILDWQFPEGYPTGEDTLKKIRGLNFKGPILIYSKSLRPFDRYIGPGKADNYIWHGLVSESLSSTIQNLITKAKSDFTDKNHAIYVGDTAFQLEYYQDLSSMGKFFYHPLSTSENTSPSSKQNAKENVTVVTSDWNDVERKVRPGTPMGKVIDTIEKLADKDIPVLILGDTGTGKELVAKALHHHHKNIDRYRSNEGGDEDLYLALNCGAFSEETLNLELFGSLPGAFTGAIEKAGIFEQVSRESGDGETIGGTVFLDELALMSKTSQQYLLRVLQEKRVMRMGYDLKKAKSSNKIVDVNMGGAKIKVESKLFGKIPVNFRLVAATNEDLRKKTEEGEFRLDLYYRIARAHVKLPTLVNRGFEDFNLLFQYFLHKYNKKHKKNAALSNDRTVLTGLSRDLIIFLWSSFPWKGNVRELEGLVDVMVAYHEEKPGIEYLCINDIPDFI